ncbi:hypothetical protein [Paenibacillus sp. CF384]|uniref:hypothetical protein n=1 Tax=Paenibacillus sp. CF384 TaxID=1884382 RepID=UPI0008958358|nr:hypothetical protein [Paenibacillus sp. CF384]SDW45857.1 hypothetical protein SAMN05518855_1002195 [Paenibacillus sp. CF384]
MQRLHDKGRHDAPNQSFFWRSSDGAVSIYLIVSTAAMLLFTALLIDLARIAAFEQQSRLAAQSGIRSALSAYDGALYEQYGLFGTGGSDRGELFAQAVSHNWTSDEGGFKLLDGKTEASHVDSYEVLGLHQVFNRQVLEEMKYKAPIDFTLEVASKFAPMASAMKEAAMSVELLEQLRQLYDEREKRLQEVITIQKEAAASVKKAIGSRMTGSARDIVSLYGSYEQWISEDTIRSMKKLPPLRTDAINFYRNYASNEADSIVAVLDEAAILHRESGRKAMILLQEAKGLNSAMEDAVKRMSEEGTGDGYDRMNQQKLTGARSGSLQAGELSTLRESREAAEGIVLDQAWFEAYEEELRHQTVDIQQAAAKAAPFRQVVLASIGGIGMSELLQESLQQLEGAYGIYGDRYIQPGTVILSRQKEMESRQSSDQERKSNEAAAESKWLQVKQQLQSMTSAPNQEDHQEAFREVKERMEANLKLNEAAASPLIDDDLAGGEDADVDAGEKTRGSMTSMGKIFSGMADVLEGIRDPLYVNEYIVHRFHSFDPKLFSSSPASGQSTAEAFSSGLALENQEVEYILYGFNEPAANVAAAYGEVFAARLAIRTMEGIIACKGLGHPLLILSAAVLYGLEKSLADMITIAQEGKVELSKYTPVEFSYLDYLRVFLLLHGSSEAKTARIIAVIERNLGGVSLSSVSTGLTGELTSSVKLWFLPGLMKSFTGTGILNGKVKGNRYEATHTIGWSYG